MKEKLEKLIEQVTNFKFLIEYKALDRETEKYIEYENPNAIWFENEIEEFFSNLYFEISKFGIEQTKHYGNGLLSLIEKRFLFNPYNYHLIYGKEDAENEFYANFDIGFDCLELDFSLRIIDAEKKSKFYIDMLKDRIKEVCGLTLPIRNEPENLAKHEIEKEIENGKKIMVNCTPAQFASIIEILMDKDYLQKRNNAEGTAKLLLKIFEFKNNNPSFESLGKVLFKEDRKINIDDYEDLNKIVHRKYLKGNKD